jgi:cell division protein FtsX
MFTLKRQNETGLIGLIRKFKWYILLPFVLGLIGWVIVLLITENQSVAPFVYATY